MTYTAEQLAASIAASVWAYCKDVGAKGLPTPGLIAPKIAAQVQLHRAVAWDTAVDEAFDLGWLHDAARDDMRDRNPYNELEQS